MRQKKGLATSATTQLENKHTQQVRVVSSSNSRVGSRKTIGEFWREKTGRTDRQESQQLAEIIFLLSRCRPLLSRTRSLDYRLSTRTVEP